MRGIGKPRKKALSLLLILIALALIWALLAASSLRSSGKSEEVSLTAEEREDGIYVIRALDERGNYIKTGKWRLSNDDLQSGSIKVISVPKKGEIVLRAADNFWIHLRDTRSDRVFGIAIS